MNHRDPKVKLARRFMSHVWLDKGYQNLDDFLIPQLLVKSPIRESIGSEHLSAAFSVWFRGFPDLVYKEKKLQIEKDRVLVEWMVEGNHLGEFLGIAATGRPIQYSGSTSLLMFDNIIHSYSADVDLSPLVEQISPSEKINIKKTEADMYLEFNRLIGVNLTHKQIDCLSLLCLRCDKEVISSKLAITHNTFRTHVSRILPLIGLSAQKEVFDWAFSSNVLELLIHIGLDKVAK